MKKELIVAGMGWGRLPEFLIQEELRARRLLSIEGKHFKRNRVDIVVARLRERVHGSVAQRLWQFMESQAPQLARRTRAVRAGTKPVTKSKR